MNPWIIRIIVILLAVAFLPVIVSGTANLISGAIQSTGQVIQGLFAPFSMRGDAKLEGVIRLCLYLIAIMLLGRVIFTNWNKK